MTGHLMERVARLITSDLADFLDIDSESSEKAIRSIDALTLHAQAELGQRLATQHQLEKSLAALNAAKADLAAKAEFAVSEGRDDLARTALSEKIRISLEVEHLNQTQNNLQTEIAHLEEALARIALHKLTVLGEDQTPGSSASQTQQLAELEALFEAQKTSQNIVER